MAKRQTQDSHNPVGKGFERAQDQVQFGFFPPTIPRICTRMAHTSGGVPLGHRVRVGWHQPRLRGGFHPELGFPPPRASRREAAALSWAHADQPKTYASSLSTDQGKESAHISQGRASGLGEPRAGQRPQRPAHDTVAGNVPAHSPEQRSGGAGRHSHAQGVVWCTTVFGAAALIVGPAPRRIPKRQPTVRAAARADPSTEGDKKLETIQWIALDTRPRGRSRSPAVSV